MLRRLVGLGVLGVAAGAAAVALADSRGSGGYGVVCPGDGNVRLYDFVEAEALWNEFHLNLGAPEIAPMAKLQVLVERLPDAQFGLKMQLRADLAAFWKEAKILPNIELASSNDADPQILPSGCELKQLALQGEPRTPQEPYFKINGNLWNALDNDHKAGLILHEIIYRLAIQKGHQTSVYARYVTASLVSLIDLPNDSAFWLKFWEGAKFPAIVRETDYQKVTFPYGGYMAGGSSQETPGLWQGSGYLSQSFKGPNELDIKFVSGEAATRWVDLGIRGGGYNATSMNYYALILAKPTKLCSSFVGGNPGYTEFAEDDYLTMTPVSTKYAVCPYVYTKAKKPW